MNKKWIPHLVTGSLIFIAVVMCFVHYSDYLENPWTRDGQVRARVIQVSPRVSGPLVKVHVKDDQYVKKGTLLFEIDPRTFQVAVEQAEAALDTTRDTVKSLEANVQVAESNVEAVKTTIDQAKAQIAQFDATLQKNKAICLSM